MEPITFASRKEARGYADRVRRRLLRSGVDVPFTLVLEGIAAAGGRRNWNVLSALLPEDTKPAKGKPVGQGQRHLFRAEREQHTSGPFVDMIYAPPGKGKSTFMATRTLDAFRNGERLPGCLPHIGVVEIGGSHSGSFAAMAASLPDERKGEVFRLVLRNKRSHAINPFDTETGIRRPTHQGRVLLHQLFRTICRGYVREDESEVLASFADLCIDRLYDAFSDERRGSSPKMYAPREDLASDEAIKAIGMDAGRGTRWWDVVDALLEAGRDGDAARAQRMAVPLTADMAAMVSAVPFLGNVSWEHTSLAGPVAEAFQVALRRLAILDGPTQVDPGGARCVCIDLADIVPRHVSGTGHIEVTVPFMLASRLAWSDWMRWPEETRGLGRWGEHAMKKLAGRRKRFGRTIAICDEAHRFLGDPDCRDRITCDVREARKWGVIMMVASQLFDDFQGGDGDLMHLATDFYVMGCTTADDREKVVEGLHLPRDAMGTLLSLNGPLPGMGGVPYVHVDRASGVWSKHLLEVDARFVWETTGSSREGRIRDALASRMGWDRAIEGLVDLFPQGSMRPEIDRMMAEIRLRSDDGTMPPLSMTAEETMAEALAHAMGGQAGPA